MSTQRPSPPTSPKLGQYIECASDVIEDALNLQANLPDGEPYRRLGELLLEREAIELDQLLSAIEAQRVERLRACPLFRDLDEDELRGMCAVFQEVTADPGDQFITQDEKDPCLYVLASGRLEVFRVDDANEELHLASVFPGEPVGEMGYFADGVRSASVRARDTAELLRANYDDLTDCFEHVPGVAAAFLEVVTHRLRKTNLLYQEHETRQRPAERALEHLSAFLELGRARELGEGIDSLIERLVFSASRLTDADRASLFLVDPDTDELWTKVAEGLESKEIRVPAGAGVVGWTVANEQMLNIADAYDDERFNPEIDRRTGYKTNTILCMPVRGLSGETIGAVQVINKQLGVFTEDDEMLLRAFAEQAAVALENINLYRDLVESHERISDLLAFAASLVEAATVAELMTRVSNQAAALLGCSHAAYYVEDSEAEVLWTVRAQDEDGERFSVAMSASIEGYCFTADTVLRLSDAYEHDRFNRITDPTPGERTKSLMCASVTDARHRRVGVLEVTNKIDGVFTEGDETLFRAMVTVLGRSGLLRS